MRYERKCLCCGTSYSYCNNCWDYRHLPAWMNSFHDENCKNIFEICTDYNLKLLTKDQAKSALSKCDLSNRDSFSDCVQRDLNVILVEDKPVVEEQSKKKDSVKDESTHEVVTKK